METFFIILHQSHKPENGYNMSLGGDSRAFTQEVCEKMSVSARLSFSNGRKLTSENLRKLKEFGLKPKSKSHKLAIAAAWNEPGRRSAQAAVARAVNQQENSKLSDFECPKCHQKFSQISRSVYGGHRKACLAKTS